MHVISRDRSTAKSSRQKVGEGLSHYLADTYLVYLKTQNFHWNVRGPNFHALHKFFEEQYLELAAAVDTIAERIRALHMVAPASFAQYLKLTSLDEETTLLSADDMLKQLLHDHQIICRNLLRLFDVAEHAGDEVTVDLITERMRAHEQTCWMLRSTLGQV
ncbi:MAG TPA: Dps family protein [Gammaproteobacteria bacterium]|nr:Dps family protein [Gammaproteobacteria bacterium]